MQEFNLNAETRCGFLVSEKRKKVWAVELEILQEFIRICEKNHLTWYVADGTLLGTIRHKGFIPWDDDVDVSMPREDYLKFMEIAPKEVAEGFWIQTPETDKHFFLGHIKVCKVGTTCMTASLDYDYPRKRYICIDIFALDVVPDSKFKRALYRKGRNLFTFMLSAYTHKEMPTGRKKTLYNLAKFQTGKIISKLIPSHVLYRASMRHLSRYGKTNNAEMGEVEFFYDDRVIWSRADFANTLTLPFENLMVNVPSGYENILKKIYGDWQTLVQGGSFHEGCIFDTDKDYTYYIQHREELKSVQEL